MVPATAVIRYGNDSWPQTHLPQYATVFMGAGRTTDLDYIRSQGATTRVLMYKNAKYLNDTCGSPTPVTCQTAVSYGEALAHDQAYPGDRWILRDSSGNPIKDRNYPSTYFANVGSASYRQRALNNVLASLKAHAGWNGVLFDHSDPGYYNSNGTPIYATAASPAYPTNSSWQTAMKGLLDAIGAPIRSQGFYVAGNASVVSDTDGSLTRAWWTAIAPDFDGFFQEYFEMSGAYVLKYNDPTVYYGNYNAELSKVDSAQSLGKDFFGGMEYHGETAATMAAEMMYGKAAILLKWNGKGGGFVWHQWNADPWNRAWTTAIGTPSGAMYAVGSGWRRNYTRGTVIVNPNKPTGSPITFKLGRKYVTPGGPIVTSVRLQPVTAMILKKPIKKRRRKRPPRIGDRPVRHMIVVLGGSSYPAFGFNIARLTPDGRDEDFIRRMEIVPGGDPPSPSTALSALVLQPNGKLAAGGMTSGPARRDPPGARSPPRPPLDLAGRYPARRPLRSQVIAPDLADADLNLCVPWLGRGLRWRGGSRLDNPVLLDDLRYVFERSGCVVEEAAPTRS